MSKVNKYLRMGKGKLEKWVDILYILLIAYGGLI